MKHDPIASGKRKSVNLSIDTGIVAAAREAGLNLSQISEAALCDAARKAQVAEAAAEAEKARMAAATKAEAAKQKIKANAGKPSGKTAETDAKEIAKGKALRQK